MAPLIAATPMTGNIIVAIAFLVAIILMLRFLRRDGQKRQRGLPLVALIAGPGCAAFYVWIDYNWIQPYNYRTLDDALNSCVPILIVGAFCGAVGAITIWIGNRLSR